MMNALSAVIAGGKRRGGAAALPYDAYTTGLAGAYAIARQVLSSHTGDIIIARRSSDDDLESFATVGGLLDTTSMLSWAGANSAYVKTIHDQSGLGRDVTSATNANQLRIINAGVMEVNANGNPVMRAQGDYIGNYFSAEYSAYTGNTMMAVVAGLWSTAIFAHLFGVTKADQTCSNAATRCEFATSPGFFGPYVSTVRNSSGIDTSVIDRDLFFAASVRYDGADGIIDAGTGAGTAARTGSFDVTRTLVACDGIYNNGFYTDTCFAEAALWFSDIGSTAGNVIRSEMATFYGAQA